MAATLKLEIVTPDAIVYSKDVQMVTLPAIEGQVGILPRHVPVLTRLVPGEIIVRTNEEKEFLAIGEGLVEITGERVAIVTDMAGGAEGTGGRRGGEARPPSPGRPRRTKPAPEGGTAHTPPLPPPAP